MLLQTCERLADEQVHVVSKVTKKGTYVKGSSMGMVRRVCAYVQGEAQVKDAVCAGSRLTSRCRKER